MTTHERALAADAAGRRAAQLRFSGTLVLEAGAGTGKTTTLVARILSWSLGRGWQAASGRLAEASDERIAAATLGGVVAITFTEAGAAEMATRVASALAQLTSATGTALPGFDVELLELDADTVQRRAEQLLGALDHLTVETIHAFCRQLLTAHPLAAGLHPEVNVDPDLRLTEEIVFEVVEHAVRRAYERPRRQPLAELATLAIGPDLIVDTIVGLRSVGLEHRALAVDPYGQQALEGVLHRLTELFARFATAGGSELRRVSSGNKAADIADALERSRDRLATTPSELPGFCALIEQLHQEWSPHFSKLASWRKGSFTKGEGSVLEECGEVFCEVSGALRSQLRHLGRMQPRRLDLARRALAPLLAECEQRAAALGTLTFSDLLARAHQLLAGRRDLRRREQRRIEQLLIDEFQDTDPLQSEIIRLLALDGPSKERPGLFLVGDPKQSIFGWRNADLAAYEGFVTDALAAGGERHQLVRNFRSDPPILAEVAAVLSPIMLATADLQPPFVNLEPDRTGSRLEASEWQPIEYWVSWADGTAGDGRDESAKSGPETRGEESAELEAAAIARDLRAVHDATDTRWSEIALLFRSTTRMDAYLEALRAAQIPFIVTRDKHYYRRKEIIEAAALVRAVVDPLDHLALVTYLRSASVGLPDAALLPLWRGDFPRLAIALTGPDSPALATLRELIGSLSTAMPEEVPGLDRIAGWEHSLLAACEGLAELRQSFRRDSAAQFVDRLRTTTLIEITEAARYQGKFRLANLDRFFRRLEQAMVDRGNDMLAILRTLRRSLTEAPDAQEAPPKDSGEDAVQVLTIHKAKGLEFDHVYVPQMHALHRRDNDLELFAIDRRWRESDEPQYSLLHSATPRWHEVIDHARQVEAMESVRLLYVALTRARQRLVLLGSWPAHYAARDATQARSQLDLVHSRIGLERSPSELEEACRERDTSWIDDGGIRWRFLGRQQPAAPRESRRQGPSWLPTGAQIETAAADHAQRQAAARSRMQRSRQQPASADSASKLATLAAQERDERGQSGPRPTLEREAAMFVGTAIHRALEQWDFDYPSEQQIELAARRTAQRLATWLDGEQAATAITHAGELWQRFTGGTLGRRWLEIGPSIVGRELPLIMPAPPEHAAIDCLTGAIDLVYRDPDDGAWVVADFKTDRVEVGDALTARAAVYAAQEAVYVEAVRQAYDLSTPPRAELWFLWADTVWRSS